jgi:hypothetical protein
VEILGTAGVDEEAWSAWLRDGERITEAKCLDLLRYGYVDLYQDEGFFRVRVDGLEGYVPMDRVQVMKRDHPSVW